MPSSERPVWWHCSECPAVFCVGEPASSFGSTQVKCCPYCGSERIDSSQTRRRQRGSQSKRHEMPELVVVKYLLFCLGAAFMQLAYMRQPDRGNLRLRTASVLLSPVIFLHPRFQLLVMALALAAWAAEIILGFVLVGWWAGLFLWIPAFMVANIFVLGRANPGPPFFSGLALAIAAVVSLAV